MQLPDEGPVFNLTLIELLAQDFEIDLSVFQNDLPKDESGVDVRGIWNTVRSKIKDTPGFEVVEDLVLSNFSFAKYLMWKDLSDRIDDLKKSLLVNHLVEKPTDPYPYKTDFIDAREVDEKIDPAEFYAPLNADSSQIAAIQASAEGKDFVLEGPPGTGKSETIANIIAHNIAHGRKVLFVSEKMAALDVVYKRLKKVGLGHLCLELHSNKATKRSVVEQLNEAWQAREGSSQEEWKKKARELGSLRRDLNRYVEELHKKSALGYSVHSAVARSVRCDMTTRIDLGWSRNLATAPVQTEEDVLRAKVLAKNLGLAFKDAAGLSPDSFSIISVSDWSPVWQGNLVDAARDLKNKVPALAEGFKVFVEALGVTDFGDLSFGAIECWIAVARTSIAAVDQSHRFALGENSKKLLVDLDLLAEVKGQYDDLIAASGLNIFQETIKAFPIEKWMAAVTNNDSLQAQYTDLVSALSELKDVGFNNTNASDELKLEIDELMKKCGGGLTPEAIVALPVSQWINSRDEVTEKNGIAKFVAKRKINSEMRRLGLGKLKEFKELDDYVKLSIALVQAQREALTQSLDQAKNLLELAVKLSAMFENYRGDGVLDQWTATPTEILERQEYGVKARRDFMAAAGQLSEPGEFMVSARKKLIDEQEFLEGSPLLRHAEKLLQNHEEIREAISVFRTLAGQSKIVELNFQELSDILSEIIASASDLNAWCHWIDAKNKAEHTGLGGVVRGLESKLIGWGDTEEQLESALCSWAAPLLISESKVLCRFTATKHNDLIETFRKLDEDVANTTGKFIAAKLAGDMPDTSGPKAPPEAGVLRNEINAKRKQPVRQLVQELGEYLLRLKPCFLMSPLSVAQYLPSDYQAFDLVVFDEASQITVWDAVGAIARGKNVIVAGDPKQMPPTNYGQKIIGDSDGTPDDLESILDQALAAGVEKHRLLGHYRSRHESLIMFSNHQYYQNSLITYPCAETRESAVIWHRVEGVYSKGSSSNNNPIEAQAVVDEVVRRLTDPELQKLSIGIVTLNSEQQRLIENLLDDERRKDTSLERFFQEDFGEPVFVKNLETVQGDQRDVIFLSFVHGPTDLGARTMSMNFGPLNKQGGERRLNVAITRSTTEMLVFSSFDAAMIDLSRTSAEAMKDLKSYIDYAARGPVALAQRTEFSNDVDQFDSDFEQAVATQLREKGWQLRTQIGVSKFRIDLGVLDPDIGGSFLAGIECDGASYHSSPSARDRDRVRHIILENLGWQLVRIWSTDYFINPGKVIDRVHNQLEELLREKREEREKREQEKSNDDAAENSFTSSEIAAEDECAEPDDSVVSEYVDEEPEQVSQTFCSAPALGDSVETLEEYVNFAEEPTLDPRETDAHSVMQGLINIVEAEGPMLAKRAYDIYLRHCGIKRMGKDLKSSMNSALQHGINKGLIIQNDEWEVGGSLYSIIHRPGQALPRFRTLGDRIIDEIPPSEIKVASRYVLKGKDVEFGSEKHLRLVLNLYGLKRLTEHTSSKLLQALEL